MIFMYFSYIDKAKINIYNIFNTDMEMISFVNTQQYTVTGMTCAACSARVEKAVSSLKGTEECSVNLLTNTVTVRGNVSFAEIEEAVTKAGYGIKSEKSENKAKSKKSESNALKARLIASVILVIILMYTAMGHTMWGLPLPRVLEYNPIAVGLVQMLIASVVMLINKRFFINGLHGVMNKAPNMDTLVAMGSGASFIYSVYALFAMSAAAVKNDIPLMHSYLHEFYFESAAMILALITLGKTLEAYSKGKTTSALDGLMKLTPKTAVLIRDGKEVIVDVSEIKKGDLFAVRTGESIPADGVITDGHCAVNEASLTGESIPIDKAAGDKVSAATVNQSGYIVCRAEKVSDDTLISQIIKMVSDASATKAPVAKAADKISGIFVPIVMGIALITAIVWLIVGESVGFSLARAISVLVISCPCALGLATPVAIMVGNGVGAKNGILFKNAASLENTGKTQIIAFDKTGTITNGMPEVTDIAAFGGETERTLLSLAATLEAKSIHPLARAVSEKAERENIVCQSCSNFAELPGNGLAARMGEEEIFGGNLKFISSKITVPEEAVSCGESFANDGKTPLFFAKGNKLVGIITVADTVKPDSREAISQLQNMGMKVIMLTGDNIKTAEAIKSQVGVDEVIAEVLPNEKANVISSLKKQGKVAMVGDGINDAPALTAADIGISVGSGTDIAIDAADIVLMKNRLRDVPAAVRLSRAALKNIHKNLFWAFIYNTIGIPIAAGVLIPTFGIRLNPMLGAAAMSLSSFFVVTNALRLNFTKIYNSERDKKIKMKKEKKTMEKIFTAEGIMCMHCEARIKKCLEAIDGVCTAEASHETGRITVRLSKDVPDAVLKSAVEAEGYKVTD